MALVLSGDSPSISGTYQGGVVTSGTAVASTSGTSIDFTSIPSWVKRITVMFNGVSTNGTSNYLIQGGSGSIENTGYISTSTSGLSGPNNVDFTTGFGIRSNAAANVMYGTMLITLVSGNTWVTSGSGQFTTGSTDKFWTNAGGKTFSGALDRVRITTVNGTDTFDAGSINILYE